MVNTDIFAGFCSQNKQDIVKLRTELLKQSVFKEVSQSQENVMERIAGSLAGAGISFMLKKSYTIEFMNDKPEYEEMKKEAESLVNTFGKEQVVFSN